MKKEEKREEKKKEKKKEKNPIIHQSSEPMIVVHVNDRLGTKAAIPCLASDPISSSQYFPQLDRSCMLTSVLSRTLQSPSGSPHWPRAPRDSVEAPG